MMAIELFSGVGGLALGFHQLGFEIKVAVEKDPEHATIYSQNYPNTKVINCSVTDISASEIIRIAGTTDIEVILGAPPCQGYSLQGKQKIDDPRSLLIWDFFEKVSIIRPKYFVMENVPGIVMPKFKPAFDNFLEKFREIGYRISWRQLNAAEYGTPQNRNRILIVGTLIGNKLPLFPKPRLKKFTVQDAIADLPEVDDFPELIYGDTLNYNLLGEPSDYVRELNRGINGIKVVSGMQRTTHSPEVRSRFLATPPNGIEPISRFKKLAWHGLSNTLKASYDYQHGNHTPCRPIHPFGKRCITVREAARLHGFPDSYKFSPTKTKAYQQIGNSVPPALSKAIAESIKEAGGRRQEAQFEW